MAVVAVVGFGIIGSALGATLAERGHNVIALDRDAALVDGYRSRDYPDTEPGVATLIDAQVAAGHIEFSCDVGLVAKADVILITVGTPLSDDHRPDLSHIRSVCDALAPHTRDGQLVILKSTVPPGTTRDLLGATLRRNARPLIAFSPERLAEGQALKDLRTLPIVTGGLDEESTHAAAAFWRESLPVDVIEMASAEAAELVKLANNLWIDVNIALANELAQLCDALPFDVDVLEVIRAANTLKKGQHNTNILTPSNGVGGYCLTKDPWFVYSIAGDHGVDLRLPVASRAINDAMPAYAARRIVHALAERGTQPSAARVAVLGFSFKSDSGDVRSTPVIPFLHALAENGFTDVHLCDPLVSSSDAAVLDVVLEDWETAIAGANVIAFMTGHAQFRSIGVRQFMEHAATSGVVFDGRYYCTHDEISAVRAGGFAYVGVGR